jgi:tetratricopeptide (TPR) repeat protein
MKKFKTLFVALLLLSSVAALISSRKMERPKPIRPIAAIVPITMCSSFGEQFLDTTYRKPALFPEMGNLSYKVSTSSAEVQSFFDQGLKLVYGFNHWEAIQSFRHAAKLDPSCAMAYWGLALAYGPNLNDINPKEREKLAFDAIRKAQASKEKLSPVEKDLIQALSARYNGKAYDNRDSLNQAYAKKMLEVSKKYREDAEVQTITADAIMNTMPWDYWEKNGDPKPATVQAKMILEKIISLYPMHPGANHLYIHLVEASPNPSAGLKSAEVLETAIPGAGHLVHMPAHIYLRTGDYSKSIEANQRAVTVDEKYLSGSENSGMYRWAYYPHNIDFISYSSYMEGRSTLALQTAMKLAYKGNLMSASNPVFAQYFSVEPMIASVRFGKWNDILSLPTPDQDFIYANLIYRFAKGMALVRNGRLDEALANLLKLDSLSRLDTLTKIYFSFNPVSEIAKVPLSLLRGQVLIAENKMTEGLSALRQAVLAEDNLRYMEPPDWKLPSRQYLGTALMDNNQSLEASKIFAEDLIKNPGNGWSLYGVYQCQSKLGKTTEAAATNKKLQKAWSNADVKLMAPVF